MSLATELNNMLSMQLVSMFTVELKKRVFLLYCDVVRSGYFSVDSVT